MAWVQSSPEGWHPARIQYYYGISTKFHRSPLPGGSDGSRRPGCCHGKKEGFGPSDHCPIFLSVGAPAEGRPAWLEHPPKRVRQGKSRQARADAGAAGASSPPLWG